MPPGTERTAARGARPTRRRRRTRPSAGRPATWVHRVAACVHRVAAWVHRVAAWMHGGCSLDAWGVQPGCMGGCSLGANGYSPCAGRPGATGHQLCAVSSTCATAMLSSPTSRSVAPHSARTCLGSGLALGLGLGLGRGLGIEYTGLQPGHVWPGCDGGAASSTRRVAAHDAVPAE